MTILAYFAYPLDVQQGKHWPQHHQVEQAMQRAGWLYFEPGFGFTVPEGIEPDPRIQQINDEAIARADVVVALLPVESHSVGVPLEIHQAATRGKTVLVWRQKRSWAIAQKNVFQFNDVEALCAAIAAYRPTAAPVVPPAGLWDMVAVRGVAEPEAVKVVGEGRLPTRHHADDAGFDLYVQGDHLIPDSTGRSFSVPCAVGVELPPGWWGMVVGRSSTFERGLLVNPGIIDPGWRGELFASVRNLSMSPIRLADGERVCQLVPIPVFPEAAVVRVEALSDHPRGTNGFGSTGR